MAAGRGRRTGVVLILLIIVVLVIGVVFVLLIRPTAGGAPEEEPTPFPTPTPPPTIDVVVAARDIPRGTQLTAQDVTIVPWPDLPDAPPPPGSLRLEEDEELTQEQQLEELVDGRIARVDILHSQPVLDHMLTPGDEPTGLGDTGSDAALMIPSGSVAIAVPITRLSSVGYALRAGDHVDLLMSFRFVDVDEDFQTILPNLVGATLLPAGLEQIGGGGISIAGREEEGPFGITLMVVPLEEKQRPRQTTQLVIDNAVVLRMGTWPLTDLDKPIVVTPAPPPTPSEEGEEGAQPTPTPIPALVVPDMITLVMTRQDALVLKYSLEVGAVIDLVLRSALDDDVTDIVTDSVTLQYIIDFYNVTEPPRFRISHDPRIDDLEAGELTEFLAAEEPGEPGPEGE
jgi:Flp pilus assembly protein CpaB